MVEPMTITSEPTTPRSEPSTPIQLPSTHSSDLENDDLPDLMFRMFCTAERRGMALHRLSYFGSLDDHSVVYPIKFSSENSLFIFLTSAMHNMDFLNKVQGIISDQISFMDTNPPQIRSELVTTYLVAEHTVCQDRETWSQRHSRRLAQRMMQLGFI